MRTASALITLRSTGKPVKIQVPMLESYMISQSLDVDADSFSIDIGDSLKKVTSALDRDTEIQVDIFSTGLDGVRRQLFQGLADTDQIQSTRTHSIEGRDLPSAILLDTDAAPGRWHRQRPDEFLLKRAKSLGITNVSIAKMKPIPVLFTDGTEKEWMFWYRIARMRGMYMWAGNAGGLVIDRLAYSPTNISYHFGKAPRGQSVNKWIMVSDVALNSNKQGRVYQQIVYAEDAKKGMVRVGKRTDNRIRGWRRRPTSVLTSSTAKTLKEANEEAHDEVYEALVGGQEHMLTVRDVGAPIFRNAMCQVNLPDYGLVGKFFIVGVQRQAGPEGFIQVVRLRERQFALSKRQVPAPVADTPGEDITNKPIGSLGGALAQQDIPFGDSFARAAREYGVANGWDFSVFLGVLLSMAKIESNFQNIRERGADGTGGAEWNPPPGSPERAQEDYAFLLTSIDRSPQSLVNWQKNFANSANNPLNPFRGKRDEPEAGVGVMQLTTLSYKERADQMGWGGKPKKDEYTGGRWNPDSNIRTAGWVLIQKLAAAGASPAKPETIWEGVKYYNGNNAQGERYAQEVKKLYEQFYVTAQAAVTTTDRAPVGSAMRSFKVEGHGAVTLPDQTPVDIAKAITWARSKLGDPYVWGGPTSSSPHYDCSSFVTAAYASASATARAIMGAVPGGYASPDGTPGHGATTYTLWDHSFQAIGRDSLLPGDLVFFRNRGHVGMYVADDLFIHAASSKSGVRWSSLGESYYRDSFDGARRVIRWGAQGPTLANDQPQSAPASGSAKRVMIQAGHDPGNHGDQPYGHTGQTGAPDEVKFTISLRDIVVGLMKSDPRFDVAKGTAWSASAGETSSASDDIDYRGHVFVSLHYDADSGGGSRFFFGTPTGRGASVLSASNKLRDMLVANINQISGHPTYSPGLNNSNEALYGYYAWGHPERDFPDSVDHTPGVGARILIECGEGGPGGADRDWLFASNKKKELARAIYRGICQYFGFNPVGS